MKAKKNLKKGLFITFEGCEGCGKSTQSRLLYQYLTAQGFKCVHTREPGGTKAGEKIREVLLHSKDVNISDLTEVFLFEAARAQIIREIIMPNLEKRKIVICDRFSDATVAYQGYGGKIPLGLIHTLNIIASEGIKPDLTVILDFNINAGLKRAKKKGRDRMESKDLSYHRRVRNGYLELAKKEPRRIKVVKAAVDLNDTQRNIREIALKLLRQR